ncbi:hypothetical protein Krad_2361 [Kineococcus radiotolerans SRS30216 = ATCC BAA-149]|uniref:Uncharacterized protein n=1 Tax=Kineococcus radiotolerans (strain ATCC BAA-149 / DSM 14245 / SRS30216) TaxID=266940 RepID=A6WAK2_KINRD|nr:hypothetical protein Krad_2361 [Kineococcus radiotolerans SRS30216 = ATCC BAA-149]
MCALSPASRDVTISAKSAQQVPAPITLRPPFGASSTGSLLPSGVLGDPLARHPTAWWNICTARAGVDSAGGTGCHHRASSS